MDTRTTHTTGKPRLDQVKSSTPDEDETSIAVIWSSRDHSLFDFCVINHAAEEQGTAGYKHGWRFA